MTAPVNSGSLSCTSRLNSQPSTLTVLQKGARSASLAENHIMPLHCPGFWLRTGLQEGARGLSQDIEARTPVLHRPRGSKSFKTQAPKIGLRGVCNAAAAWPCPSHDSTEERGLARNVAGNHPGHCSAPAARMTACIRHRCQHNTAGSNSASQKALARESVWTQSRRPPNAANAAQPSSGGTLCSTPQP